MCVLLPLLRKKFSKIRTQLWFEKQQNIVKFLRIRLGIICIIYRIRTRRSACLAKTGNYAFRVGYSRFKLFLTSIVEFTAVRDNEFFVFISVTPSIFDCGPSPINRIRNHRQCQLCEINKNINLFLQKKRTLKFKTIVNLCKHRAKISRIYHYNIVHICTCWAKKNTNKTFKNS